MGESLQNVNNLEEETTPTKKTDFPVYKSNPFCKQLVVKTKKSRVTVGKGKHLVDIQTGEVENPTEICQIRLIDKEEFVKVYTRNIHAFFDLSAPAYKLIQIVFILTQQHVGVDEIYLNPEHLPTEAPQMKRAYFYKGLPELLAKGFLAICEGRKHWYYINPALFFNGDRVRFITEYRKKPITTQEQLSLPLVGDGA